MHSCELVVPPPAQGAALLLELGTLIIEGRNSKSVAKSSIISKVSLNLQSSSSEGVDRKDVESEASRGALPKRPAPSSASMSHLSPAKRNRDQACPIPKSEEDELKHGNHDDTNRKGSNKNIYHKNSEDADPGKTSASTSGVSEGLSVYDLKARLASAGGAPLRGRAEALWRDHTPLCIEVLLAPDCGVCREPVLLLERWTMSVYSQRTQDQTTHITSQWLLNAVRSQLHFSQISAWSSKLKEETSKLQEQQAKARRDLSPSERQRKLSRETCNFKKYESNCDEELLRDDLNRNSSEKDTFGARKLNVIYNLKIPEDDFKTGAFQCQPLAHKFPITDIGSNIYLEVHLESLPRLDDIPVVHCMCSISNSDIFKRRRSKDMLSEQAASEEILCRKLALACSVVEMNASRLKMSVDAEEMKNRMKRSSFSPDLGAINSDMGCSSGISRKFPIFSSPNTPEFSYQVLSSRGSTPDRSDMNDSGFPSSTKSGESSQDPTLSKFKDENSYHLQQYSGVSNIQVPSDKLIEIVDDRMQTPCRQSGKHRCNCDDESDQGAKDTAKGSNHLERNATDDHTSSPERSSEYYINLPSKRENKGNERRSKDGVKFTRRLRKEPRAKQDTGQSCQDNTECRGPTPNVRDLTSNRKIRTCSSSDNSDNGRSSPELVHYNSVCHNCHGCIYRDQYDQKNCLSENCFPYASEVSNRDFMPSSKVFHYNQRSSESNQTTSIPILQASRFDHVNRFGNFRSSVSFNGNRRVREIYLSKQNNNSTSGCDQAGSPKSCGCQNQEHCSNQSSLLSKNSHLSDYTSEAQTSCCHSERVSSKKSDDDYRPSAKKLISSYTQTDDILCGCGRSLIPMCSECSSLANPTLAKANFLWKDKDQPSNSVNAKMKRSEANHNLAAVDKSSLFLEAIERTSRMKRNETNEDLESNTDKLCDSSDESVSKCHDFDVKENVDKRLVVGHDKKVIDNNCDNSVSTINNCECDKNRVYSDSFKQISCTNDPLSHSTPLFSFSDSYDNMNTPHFGEDSSSAKSDLSILIANKRTGHSIKKQSGSNSVVRKLPFKDKPPDPDKNENFIRKPKLKRFASAIDKIEKIVVDRNKRKLKHSLLDKDSIDVDSQNNIYVDDVPRPIITTPNKTSNSNDSYYTRSQYEIENHFCNGESAKESEGQIIIYERGDFGSFGRDDDKLSHKTHTTQNSQSIDSQKSVQDTNNPSFPNIHIQNSTDHTPVPSVSEMDKFRWRLDSAASMVFHSRTGLPLTSSPAPLRRGKSCFDYDSTINSVSSIKSALYGLSNADIDTTDPNPVWSPGSSPGSPSHVQTEAPIFNYNVIPKTSQQILSSRHNKFRHGTSSGLLGSFEESVLNGRLEPAATVAGFTAEIGASGEFCPSHLKLPVTVFFYSLGDNTTSSPYLGHINLGRKGYCVPRAGTIQVTLFNPHGTVVKMFVVMYDLGDMPPHSRTFLRQRTLWGGTCLRYLIHLRFLTSKSGKVYLHTDIRIIVSRKADLDTAAAHSLSSGIMMNAQKNPPEATENGKKTRGKIETGTFQKRSSLHDERKTLNRSSGCYELSTYCNNSKSTNEATVVKPAMPNCKSPPISGSLSSVFNKELSYELRSFTYGPDNPKYSPR